MKALYIATVKHSSFFQNDNAFVGFQHFFTKPTLKSKSILWLKNQVLMNFYFENKHQSMKVLGIAITKHFVFLEMAALLLDSGIFHPKPWLMWNSIFRLNSVFLMNFCFQNKQQAMKVLCIAVVKHFVFFKSSQHSVGFQHFLCKTHIDVNMVFELENQVLMKF